MKKQIKKVIHFISTVLCCTVLISGCTMNTEDKVMEEGKKFSYELSDYCGESIMEIEQEIDTVQWEDEDDAISAFDGQVLISNHDGQITQIRLSGTGKEDFLWTLCGISPGMKLETVLEKLEQTGIVIERHNMQYYASGVDLEKMGIARLEWDPNETITYVNAVVDMSKVDELKDYELVVKEEQFVYCDEERNVNIVIDYPVVEVSNHQELAEQMNGSIEEIVQEILPAEELSGWNNISIDIEYSLKNVESERFSILWEGTLAILEGEYEVRKALTYNMLENSVVLGIAESGWTDEQLASELSWQLELEEEVAEQILNDQRYEFYVTPLYLVVIYEDKEAGEYQTVSVFR